MKSWHVRAIIISISLVIFLVSLCIILFFFNTNITLFFSPTELHKMYPEDLPEKSFRVGGLVVEGSVVKNNDCHSFKITDLDHVLNIEYCGVLPNLFKENQGIVAFGKMKDKDTFIAGELLAKHDENYMPREVVQSLKKSEQWREYNDENKPPYDLEVQ